MTLQMSIIKIEIKIPELVKALERFKTNSREAFEVLATDIKTSVADVFNQSLTAEMNLFLGESEQD